MTTNSSSKIAIVGMSCRLPGANTPEQFWHNLREGVESREELTAQDLSGAGVDRKFLSHPNHVPVAFTLDDVAGFDASFFYLNAREAEKMDPQLRIFLETAWHALEHAGYNSENYDGDIGVFASGLSSTYLLSNLLTSREHFAGDVSALLGDMVARMGNDANYLATRTSYHLNLTGPSISVQTACSSSLVAVHQAVESLLAGECDVALAGGVSVRFPSKAGYIHQPDGILSRDGHCRPFDADASGTVFGDGCGTVVLKRLDDALAQGDTIHAVILASAVGNDGSDKVGYAAPGVSGQVKVVQQALELAGIDMASVGYIEAHGTGTPMGDPIEVQALKMVFAGVPAGQRVALGSVKGNIGHLSIAAGVAGLIKTVLMLKNRELVATANFRAPNPQCGMDSGPFWVPQATAPWGESASVLRAGISSFGMGGTNCHMVLEQAPRPAAASGGSRPLALIPLSAKSPEALQRALDNAVAYLGGEPAVLADVAYTYAVGRRTFNHRQVAVAASAEEAVEVLSGQQPGMLMTGTGQPQPQPQPVTFMFPGQGSQYAAMLQACHEHEEVFRSEFDRCAQALLPLIGADLREIVFPQRFPSAGSPARLNETQFTQPALFAVEYALARQWMHWGIRPTALIGHSVGEIVAACLAGVFKLEDALALIAARGRLVQALPSGAMLAVPMAPAALQERLPEGLAIAAVNEPAACTVSGPTGLIDTFAQQLAKERIAARRLSTSHAFHSAMMAPAQDELRRIVGTLQLSSPAIPIVSNLTGTWLTAEQACSPEYWADHLRQTVQFAEGVETLLRGQAQQILLEVGPGQALASFVRRHPEKEVSHQVLTSVGRIKQPADEYRSMVATLGKLWALGTEIDWRGFFGAQRRHRVALPVYPFEHERFYAEPSQDYRLGVAGQEDDGKQPLENWAYAPVWTQSIDTFTGAAAGAGAGTVAGPVLVFADGQGVADALAQRLAPLAEDVITVKEGPQARLEGRGPYAVRAHHRDDFVALLKLLQGQGRLPATVLHLWSLDAAAAGLDRDRFEQAQQLGVYSLTYLIQALSTLNITHPMRWRIVTRNAYAVSGAERLAPEQSTANVFAKVISQEYAQIDCRLVDIDEAQGALAAESVLQEVVQETPREYGVAYRHQQRWALQMQRVRQPAQWNYKAATKLARNGVYLITGGLGEIGTTLATMLAQDYQARLALLVREPMPARPQWDAHLAAGDGSDLVSRRIKTVRQLEACGAEVLVVEADVADRKAMEQAVAAVVATFGSLDGVFHAAGLPGEKWDRTIESAEVEQIQWHFQAKAYGTQVLAQVLRGCQPRFCVLISSIASMLGGLRLGPYGCANHYMDNLAALLNREQAATQWVAIDWDVWQHHQDEKRESSALGKMMDERTVLPQQGLEVIERVLAMRGVHQISVSTWDMEVRARRWVKRASAAGADTPSAGGTQAADASHDSIEQDVLALLNRTLGAEVLGLEDDFFEAGGDSLISLQLLTTVRERYGVNVSLARFLNRPTALSLATLVKEQMKPAEDELLALVQNGFLAEQEAMLMDFIDRIRGLSEEAVLAELA